MTKYTHCNIIYATLNMFQMLKYNICSRLGYGILGLHEDASDRDLCGKTSDGFKKEHETVFQMKVGDFSAPVSSDHVDHDIVAKEWIDYSQLESEKAGYLCEKEGTVIFGFILSIPLIKIDIKYMNEIRKSKRDIIL